MRPTACFSRWSTAAIWSSVSGFLGQFSSEKVASFDFWPYDEPVYVASNSLKSVPDELEGKAQVMTGELPSMMYQLEYKDIGVVNVDDGLLNEITVTTLPVILGQGISLFGHSDGEVQLKLEGSEVLLNQLEKHAKRSQWPKKFTAVIPEVSGSIFVPFSSIHPTPPPSLEHLFQPSSHLPMESASALPPGISLPL